MGIAIRRIASDDEAGIATCVRIRNAVTPDNPDSPEQVRWANATYPGELVGFLAETPEGTAVGAGSAGRIWMHGPEYERYWLGIWVLPEARRQGVGSALLAAASDAARAADKTGFRTSLSEAHTDGHRFLANRGFVEVDRSKTVRLSLRGLDAPVAVPPPGIRFVTLADRPELVAGVHRVALEAFPDIPMAEDPLEVGTLEAFAARDVTRAGIPQDGFFVALDEAPAEVVGYASLIFEPGSTTVAYHDMTAVRPAYRGRGIATALKLATIAWAVDHGLEALETGNDEGNAPMRAVNARLGYVPLPDEIGLQGPLAPER